MLGTLGHDPSALPPPFTLGSASATAQAKGNTKQPTPHSGEDQFPGAKPAPALPPFRWKGGWPLKIQYIFWE